MVFQCIIIEFSFNRMSSTYNKINLNAREIEYKTTTKTNNCAIIIESSGIRKSKVPK